MDPIAGLVDPGRENGAQVEKTWFIDFMQQLGMDSFIVSFCCPENAHMFTVS